MNSHLTYNQSIYEPPKFKTYLTEIRGGGQNVWRLKVFCRQVEEVILDVAEVTLNVASVILDVAGVIMNAPG